MSTNNENYNMNKDASYGGCKYRLSYDAVEIKPNNNVSPKGRRALNTAIAISLIAFFIIFGVFIFSYYKNAIKGIFDKDRIVTTEKASQAHGTGVNVVTE